MSESVGEKLRRNTRAMLLTWAWGQGLNFIRMMVLIEFLSTEGYGLWLFAFAIMSYFSIYNFGIANAFVKYAAEYFATNRIDRMSQTLSTGMALGVLLAAGVVAVLLLFTDSMIAFFDVEADNTADLRYVLIGVGLTTAFTLATSVYQAVLTGIQRLDLRNYCYVAVQSVEFTAMVILLNMGYGLRMVVGLYAAGLVANTLLAAMLTYRLVPGIRLNPLRASRTGLRDMLSLGGRMHLLVIVAMLVSTLDIVVFMKFGGAAFVGVYGAAQRVAHRAQGAAQQGFGALAPASADLIARKQYDELAEVYGAAQRFTAVGCAWLFAYSAIFAEPIMRFVMDEEYEAFAAYALTVVSIGVFFHSMTGPGSSMLRGAGRTAREIAYQLLTVVLFAALFFGWKTQGRWSSIPGDFPIDPALVAAWPIALGTASLGFVLVANRFFRAPGFAPFSQSGLLLLVAPTLAYLVRAGWYALEPIEATSRWPAFAVVLPTGALYTLLFFGALWCLPGLTREDRERLIRFVPGGHRFLKQTASAAD